MNKYCVERDDRELQLSGEKYLLRSPRGGVIAVVYTGDDAGQLAKAMNDADDVARLRAEWTRDGVDRVEWMQVSCPEPGLTLTVRRLASGLWDYRVKFTNGDDEREFGAGRTYADVEEAKAHCTLAARTVRPHSRMPTTLALVESIPEEK